MRESLAETIAGLKEWLTSPWSVARGAKLAGLLAALVAAGWAMNKHWREVWRMLARGTDARRDDPVRADAGRWLGRLREADLTDVELKVVVGELQRLRFGARPTWSEPNRVFHRARQAWRSARTARRRVTRP